MKHLLPSAIFVICSLVAGNALATDDLCDARGTIKRNPLALASGVPRNARLPVEWDSGCGKLSAELFDGDGAVVPTRIASAGFVSAVAPLSPLAANRDHRLVVRELDEVLAELTFKTGDFDAAPAPSEAPVVEVRGYEWVAGHTDVARFTVAARQPNGDRLGVLSIAYDDTGTDAQLPGGDGEVTFVRGLRAEDDVEKCFTVSYTDAAGNVSPSTGRACVTPSGNPNGGCSVAPRSKTTAGGFGVVAAVALAAAAVGRRRRAR